MPQIRWHVLALALLVPVYLVFATSCVSRRAHEQLQTELADVQSQLSEVEAARTTLESEVTGLTEELADAQSQLSEVEAAKISLESNLTVALGQIETLQTNYDKTITDLEATQGQIETLQANYDEAITDLEVAQSQIQALEGLPLQRYSYDETVTVDTFDGTWKGELILPHTTFELELRIEGDNAWVVFSPDFQPSLTMERLGPNLVLYFIAQGGLWTETQVYTLSSLTEDTVQILYTRQVHNEGSTTWSIQGSAVLERQ